MGIIAQVIDLDKKFQHYKQSGERVIFINDFNLSTKLEKEEFNRILISEYEGDSISNIPSCTCKKYRSSAFYKRKCEVCGDYVLADLEKPIRPAAWIRTPSHIHKLINPILLTQLNNAFRDKMNAPKKQLLRWFLDPKFYVSDPEAKVYFEHVEEIFKGENIPRGINSFYENFHRVIDILAGLQMKMKPASKKVIPPLVEFIKSQVGFNKDGTEKATFFCSQLPMQSKSMFIVEKTASGKFAGDLMIKGIEVAVEFSNMERNISTKNGSRLSNNDIKTMESRCVRALYNFSQYHLDDFRQNWANRDGNSILRTHIYSSRTDWSGRAVINSIQDIFAKINHLHCPWSVGMVIFEAHIYSKLQSRGYSDKDCSEIIRSSIMNNTSLFKPLLRKIFTELLEECTLGDEYGIPGLFLRNPAMKKGSSSCLMITKIKDDCEDKTFEMHLCAMPAPNADVDGDQMTLTPMLDEVMYKEAKKLSPCYYAMDNNRPLRISGDIKNTNESKITIRHWLESNY